MNRTPKSISLRVPGKVSRDRKVNDNIISIAASTPVTSKKSLNRQLTDDECISPINIRFTQDGGDDELDVVWEWNSPQSKICKTAFRHKKRVLNNLSPNIPGKLTSKLSQVPTFSSLKAELEKLADKLSNCTDSLQQSCLIIDLPDEKVLTARTEIKNNNIKTDLINEANLNCAQDLFDDDSLDEEMIRCSQQAEEAYRGPIAKKLVSETLADDSFDNVLGSLKDEEVEFLSQVTNCKNVPTVVPVNARVIQSTNRTIVRTNSTPNKCSVADPSVFPRTKSAEYNIITSKVNSLDTVYTLDEIKKNTEKQRLN